MCLLANSQVIVFPELGVLYAVDIADLGVGHRLCKLLLHLDVLLLLHGVSKVELDASDLCDLHRTPVDGQPNPGLRHGRFLLVGFLQPVGATRAELLSGISWCVMNSHWDEKGVHCGLLRWFTTVSDVTSGILYLHVTTWQKLAIGYESNRQKSDFFLIYW